MTPKPTKGARNSRGRATTPFVVAVGGGKGGTGKTTIAANLAVEGLRQGLKVLVVDADDGQASLATWGDLALEREAMFRPQIVQMGENLRHDLGHVAETFDLVIIDCPGAQLGKTGLARVAVAAFAVADFILMPFTPGPTDVWSVDIAVEAVENVRSVRPEIQAGIVLNRLGKNVASRTLREALEGLAVPVLRSELRALETVSNAIAEGQGVTAFKPKSLAAKELCSLYREVVSSPRSSGKAKHA